MCMGRIAEGKGGGLSLDPNSISDPLKGPLNVRFIGQAVHVTYRDGDHDDESEAEGDLHVRNGGAERAAEGAHASEEAYHADAQCLRGGGTEQASRGRVHDALAAKQAILP